jgi:hypothetical protein
MQKMKQSVKRAVGDGGASESDAESDGRRLSSASERGGDNESADGST